MGMKTVLGLLCTVGVLVGAAANAGTLTVTTLEWPPYTSEVLPKQGATTEVVRQAFEGVGTDGDVAILPWKRAIPAPDDITNLRKLARQRIDVAVIDKLVLSYLLATESSLQGLSDTLVFDERPLEEKTLYLCFKDDEAGRSLPAKFNEGLAQIDIELIVENDSKNEF